MEQDIEVVALGGYAGAGKDTIAQHLIPHLAVDRSVHLMAFADSLRDCAAALGLSRIHMADPNKKNTVWKYGHTYRDVLKILGTAVREQIGQVWIDNVSDTINRMRQTALSCASQDQRPLTIIITDLRFDREAEMVINRHDGIIIDITRPGIGPHSEHISEQKTYLHRMESSRHLHVSNEFSLDDERFDSITIQSILNHLNTQRKGR